MHKDRCLTLTVLSFFFSVALAAPVLALNVPEPQQTSVRSASRYTFNEGRYNFYDRLPWREEPDAVLLGRAEAFGYLHNQYSGIGGEGHVFGSARTKGIEFKVHHTGPMRGVTVMYKQVVW